MSMSLVVPDIKIPPKLLFQIADAACHALYALNEEEVGDYSLPELEDAIHVAVAAIREQAPEFSTSYGLYFRIGT
jgi:hypothetical protein